MSALHESFLRHARFRYLHAAMLLCVLSICAYVWHDPIDGPNGGTWLGYTLGTIGALLIVWLTWFGVRKRSYRSRLGTVKGWLSAHVYLGLSLLVIATLHSGFQFGWNVHTLAYVLMLLVIASGVYGIVAYARYPAEITEAHGQTTRDALIDEVMDLNEQALKLADRLGPDVHGTIVRSAQRARIGGGLRAQLFGPRKPTIAELEQIKLSLGERLRAAMGAEKKPAFDPNSGSTVMFMAGQLADMRNPERDSAAARQLLDVLSRRNSLVERVNRDIRLHARMQIWLYLHVPLTAALLAALTAHILSVFIYW